MVSASRIAFLSLYRPTRSVTSPPLSRLTLRNLISTAAAISASPSRKTTTFNATPLNAETTPPRPMNTSDLETLTGYLNAKDAASLDVDLMSTPGYSLEQLMELAGLSVAEAVYEVLRPISTKSPSAPSRVLIVCGPGNNGGDGLVAARHLLLFGMECDIVYPKPAQNRHFTNLVRQCEDVGVDFLESVPDPTVREYDAVVDAIFGFSFRGEPREPLAGALSGVMELQKTGVTVISVDVPSGWNVDEGDVAGTGFVPDVLVSLTAPKDCSRGFTGRHFVGGRFVPKKIQKKYNIRMPPYPGVSQVMEIPRGGNVEEAGDWRAEYAEYCAKQEEWSCGESKVRDIPKGGEEEWARQYAHYLAEKQDAEKEAAKAEKDDDFLDKALAKAMEDREPGDY